MNEEGIKMKSQPNPNKRVEKKSNTIPKGVETRSSKLDQKAKVKPNVGTPDKPGKRSSRKARELESMQNIVDGRQATLLEFTPKK